MKKLFSLIQTEHCLIKKKTPKEYKKAIQLLKENGVFVAIATGRAPFMFTSLRKELDIDSYVSFNGQYVVFENEAIYKNPLKQSELERFQLDTKTNEHPLIFMNELTMKATTHYHPYIETSMGSLLFPHPDEDRSFFIDNEIYQSLLFAKRTRKSSTLKISLNLIL